MARIQTTEIQTRRITAGIYPAGYPIKESLMIMIYLADSPEYQNNHSMIAMNHHQIRNTYLEESKCQVHFVAN